MNKKTIVLGLLILFLVCFFGYKKFYQKGENVRYVLSRVEKGTISLSVSGSGNIEAYQETEILPKATGKIQKIFVKKGDFVKEGQLLIQLDTKDLENTISNLETQVETTKINLESAKNSLSNLENSKKDTQKDLEKAYKDTFDLVSATFNLFPQVFQKLDSPAKESSYDGDYSDFDYYHLVVNTYSSKKEKISGDEIEKRFEQLKEKYQNLKQFYLGLNYFSDEKELDSLFENTKLFLTELFEFTKENRDTIYSYKDLLTDDSLTPPIPLSVTENQLSLLVNFTDLLAKNLSDLRTSQNQIKKLKTSLENLEKNIEDQKNQIKSLTLQLEQKEKDLSNTKDKLKDYQITANLTGEITDWPENLKEGDLIGSGSLGKILTKTKIVKITLNEIDVAKVEIGQKATLTFDALPDLTLTGKVIEMDKAGTVSQGVTSYGIKIGLDADDERLKPGMSVNAEIIVGTKPDVLTLPNSAIKSEGNSRFVQLIDAPEAIKKKLKIGTSVVLPKEVKIKNQPVEVGISNDTLTEILSGVSEGDIVISSKITPQTQTTQTQFRFQIPGMGAPAPQRR